MSRKRKNVVGDNTNNGEAGEVEVVKQYKHYYCCEKHGVVAESDVESKMDLKDAPWCVGCVAHKLPSDLIHIVAESYEEAEKKFETLGKDPLAPEGAHPLGKGETLTEPVEVVMHPGYVAGQSEIIQYIGLEQLRESTSNPRRHYDENSLGDLAVSIKAKGIVQNLVVRQTPSPASPGLPLGKGETLSYEVVAGSRRFRAAKIAELKAVPCVVRNYTDAEVLEIQVIENNQREDVHPLEEGEGYAALLQVEGYTVESIAGKIGRSDKYVRERLQLAKLSPKAKEYYEQDKIKYTHARIISRLTHSQQDEALAQIVQKDTLTSATHVLDVKSLEWWISWRIEKKLSKASFPLDDKTLDKDMGACIGCKHNTASDGQLFPEYVDKAADGVCLLPHCYVQKTRTYAERLVKEKAADEKYKDALFVSDTSWKNNLKKFKSEERLVIGYENWDKCKKGEAGAKLAVLVGTRETEKKGKPLYVKLKNKKDAAPSKSDKKSNAGRHAEPTETLEQKAERERLESRRRFCENAMNTETMAEVIKASAGKIDKKIIANQYADEIQSTREYLEAWVAGMDVEEYDKLSHGKQKELLVAALLKLSPNEMFIVTFCCNRLDYGNRAELAKMFKIDGKKIEAKIEKLADEKYPDPAKQLLVSFQGLKYKLKEADYVKELQVISDKIRFQNKKEGSDYKELNVINPGGNNVCFRKDAKSGLYRFSTWIDSDGTAMGFDKLAEAKFVKMVRGFAAVKRETSDVKRKKGKKK